MQDTRIQLVQFELENFEYAIPGILCAWDLQSKPNEEYLSNNLREMISWEKCKQKKLITVSHTKATQSGGLITSFFQHWITQRALRRPVIFPIDHPIWVLLNLNIEIIRVIPTLTEPTKKKNRCFYYQEVRRLPHRFGVLENRCIPRRQGPCGQSNKAWLPEKQFFFPIKTYNKFIGYLRN